MTTWTDERVKTLKRMWADGASCGQIAKVLGADTTRNMVIGKAHRLNLAGRERKSQPKLAKPKRATFALTTDHAIRRPKPPRPLPDRSSDSRIPLAQRCSLQQLTSQTCRWPVGHPGTPQFFFCGAEPQDSKPYCASHCAEAYQPAAAPGERKSWIRWTARSAA